MEISAFFTVGFRTAGQPPPLYVNCLRPQNSDTMERQNYRPKAITPRTVMTFRSRTLPFLALLTLCLLSFGSNP
ncbi:MAG: hypothetical protein ABI072_08090, partial [Edaphobacter sp.]